MVKILFNNYWYDLTDYVTLPVSVKLTGDKTFDSASFTLPSVGQVFSGLDVSRAFPRYAKVNIDGVVMFLQTDSVTEVGDEWEHAIECISLAKYLADITNAGLTVTQPSGDEGLYYRSLLYNENEKYTINANVNDTAEISFDLKENSIDTSDIDGNEMKKNKRYTIALNGVIYTEDLKGTPQYPLPPTTNIDLLIVIDGSIVFQKYYELERQQYGLSIKGKVSFNHSFEYVNAGTNEVKVYAKLYPTVPETTGSVTFDKTSLTIATTEFPSVQKITLDYVMDKLLTNDANKQKFFLDDNTRSFLKEYPFEQDLTLAPSYLWLQITRIADFVKGFPTARYGEVEIKTWEFVKSTETPSAWDMFEEIDTFLTKNEFMKKVNKYGKTYPNGFVVCVKDPSTYWFAEIIATTSEEIIISIDPFDPQESVPVGVDSEAQQATIDDYASGLELNADLYSENNLITEIVPLQASGGVRAISVEDLIIPTSHPIGKIVSFKMRVPTSISVGSILASAGSWVEIDANRILRQEYYNTLPSVSEYNGVGRYGFSKNNCLYFTEGERNISGLTYIGETEKSILGSTYIRGIYELLIAQLVRDNGDPSYNDQKTGYDTGTVAQDNSIAVEVVYRPYTKSNAVIYKSDQSGFQVPSIKYLNEEMPLNAPDVIGSYAQGIADRSGGTLHTFTGYCRKDELPPVLSKWGDLVLFAVAYNYINWEEVSYVLSYIKDYVFVATSESYNPKEKVFLTPKDRVQDRVIKKNILIEIGTTSTPSDVGIVSFIRHLSDSVLNVPTFAKLNHDGRLSTLPVVSQAVGRVVEFRVEMKDNYSAGLQKILVGSASYQQDFPYTDIFGRVEETLVEFYKTRSTPGISQINALPAIGSLTFSGIVGEMQFRERKDARERSVYSLQYAYLSQESDILIIYDGIAKYADTVVSPPKSIKWAEVTQVPSRHATQIDRTTIIRQASVTRSGNEIEIDTLGSNAVVCYEDKYGEILLADTRKTLNRVIYFGGKNK